MIHEFNDSIRVNTPVGNGYAIFVDCGNDDYWWTIALDNGAIVTFQQSKIRLARSYTKRRGITDAQMRKIIKCP